MIVAVGSFRHHLLAACLAAAMTAVVTSQIAAAQATLKNFIVYEAPKPIPAIQFDDDRGQARSLADLKGKVVVLSIWATWCVPCRKEMPTLDRLQAALGGPDFAVVPLSIDRGGNETVAKFYGEIGIRDLPIYVDASGQAIRKLGAVGLPTTLVLDRDGQQIVRVVGPAEWDAPEVIEFLKSFISRPAGSIKTVEHGDVRGQLAQSDTPGLLARAFRWLKTLLVN